MRILVKPNIPNFNYNYKYIKLINYNYIKLINYNYIKLINYNYIKLIKAYDSFLVVL